MVIKINLGSDTAHVYKNGKKVRTIYVSGGKAGWQTRSGTKLIMSHEYNKKMTNEMIGAAEHYDLTIAYAMRITNSGEFLHSAPWNAGLLRSDQRQPRLHRYEHRQRLLADEQHPDR